MTDCANAEIRDQLPDLLHGRLDGVDRARAEAHVRTCAECAGELDLLRALRGAAPAPAVDVARIVSALSAPRRARRVAGGMHVWQIAAAVVFVAAGGSTLASYARRVHVADSTAAARVASRQDSAAGRAAAGGGAGAGDVELNVGYGYGDLTDAQLEALLKDVENMKAVPMADPETSVPTVAIGNGGF